MKLRSKIATVMTILGITIILLTSIFYYYWSQHLLIEEEMDTLTDISLSASHEINTHLYEISNTVLTLSSSPVIRDTLIESNNHFSLLTVEEREDKIETLSQQWTETTDLNSPFLQSYLNNPVASHLRLQKELIKERYGELFITNRYGVIIATTNKLTTINHAHKYWWEASFNDGIGRIFIDDRGFDASAYGYVIGVVVPIIYEDKIIGIMKCNVNILDILDHVMLNFENLYEDSTVRIVRTGGLIVSELGSAPLSKVVPDRLIEVLDQKENQAFAMKENEVMQLMGVSEVPITKGSSVIGFGGSYESIDHIKGNTGESWHVVVSIKRAVFSKMIESTTQMLILIGIIITLITSFVSLYLGKKISDPLVALTHFTHKVGEGSLGERIKVTSNDEIGILSSSFNEMVENLQTTMASKNELITEIEKRTVAEEKLKSLTITDELTKINNRRAANQFLHQTIERAERYDEKLSVIILDIDHFKKVNNSHGHDYGDTVLITLSSILSDCIRTCDMVARIGGEEFLIILPQISKESAYQVAERIRNTVSEYNFTKLDQLTVSMGVAEFDSTDDFDTLLKRADDGLYHSKNTGRNKVTLF
ncbi:MAG: diguanylate cyclase [Clostridiales bacterium]|nr:diguanylate cyclase [Clostridiales bacterium]